MTGVEQQCRPDEATMDGASDRLIQELLGVIVEAGCLLQQINRGALGSDSIDWADAISRRGHDVGILARGIVAITMPVSGSA